MNLKDILDTAFGNGLVGAIEVAVDENDFDKRLDLAETYGRIGLSAGIHPSSSAGDGTMIWRDRFEKIEKQAKRPSVVAIGESGLDFFRDYAPRKVQETAFRDQLALACELDKPIIIHNRNADGRILEIIEESSCRGGVFHCFSSDWETAHRVLDLGYDISLAGNITYKRMGMLHEAARRIPPDRLLIETDSPYLSPQCMRNRGNHPGHIGYTLEFLAEIRKEDPASLAWNTTENARRVFAYKRSGK